MAQFPVLRLTRAGQDMVGASQGGGKLIFVRAELGDGQLGEGDSIETLSAIKHRVMQLPLQGCLNEGNGKARLRFVVDNGSLTAGFFNREIGIIAKMEGGDEKLYAYTNAGNYADYIPSKDTPVDSEIIDLHILIGNASQVVLQTANGAYATKIELEEHRTAAELDHPNKSVHKKHLAFEVYDKGEVYTKSEVNKSFRYVGYASAEGNVDWDTLREPTTYKIQGCTMSAAYHAPPNEYNFGLLVVHCLEAGKDHENRTVQIYYPHATRGYWSRMLNGTVWTAWSYIPTRVELNVVAEQKASARVNKNGDTMTGALNFQNNLGTCLTGTIADNDMWRVFAHQDGESNKGYLAIDVADDGDEAIYARQFTGDFAHQVRYAKILGPDGTTSFPVSVTAPQYYASDWFRARGNVGFYFQDHGGGWFMEDDYWIRAYNNKSVYTGGKIKADGGFEGKASSADWADSAGNSNTLAGQSLQWIIDRINEAKTGIVAGNLDENGWIKFANGLILQWGVISDGGNGWRDVPFPVSFTRDAFIVDCFYRGTDISNHRWEDVIPRKITERTFKVYIENIIAYKVSYIAIGV